jgi:transcription termination factor Rho
MSADPSSTSSETAASPAAKPKRAPAKKAVKAEEAAPAATKKTSAKKAPAKKVTPSPETTAAPIEKPARPSRAKAKPSSAPQPELTLSPGSEATPRPRRSTAKSTASERAIENSQPATPPPPTPPQDQPSSVSSSAPPPPINHSSGESYQSDRDSRDSRDRRDGRDNRDRRDRNNRGPRGPRPDQGQRYDQGPRPDHEHRSEQSPRPEQERRFEQGPRPEQERRFDQGPRPDQGQRYDQGSRPSESSNQESNRSRRWNERRNRFKKWKDRRRGGDSGESSASSPYPSGDSQGTEAPPPLVPLGPPEPAEGILELTSKGYGFLRQRSRSFAQLAQDPFVDPDMIRKYGLREGMLVKGQACRAQRGHQMTEITEVNNRVPEAMRDLPLFEELKAVNPNKRIQLETDKNRLTTRVIDMFTPVGRGQRGLIVAPPRTGKTTLLQHIAEAVSINHPGTHLMLLLVDERPEEVTEFKRILPNAEIFASSNDQDIKSHTRIAQFAIERAKRLVECGEHVFILLDSITRLARAFNNAKQGGATMSGGVGVGALEIPRRLFAAARNTREAGSLTILATALIETGSRMDDLIFQEFKGTGNMELVLDRKIAEQMYYPAANVLKSGTRREELLLQGFQLDKIHMLRRGLAGHKPIEALQRVLSLLERYPSNAQMLVDLPSKS